MWLLEEVESARRELTDGRHRLKVAENVCDSIEHDWFIVEEAYLMVEHWLDLYIGMNEDLTRELKVNYYILLKS